MIATTFDTQLQVITVLCRRPKPLPKCAAAKNRSRMTWSIRSVAVSVQTVAVGDHSVVNAQIEDETSTAVRLVEIHRHRRAQSPCSCKRGLLTHTGGAGGVLHHPAVGAIPICQVAAVDMDAVIDLETAAALHHRVNRGLLLVATVALHPPTVPVQGPPFVVALVARHPRIVPGHLLTVAPDAIRQGLDLHVDEAMAGTQPGGGLTRAIAIEG